MIPPNISRNEDGGVASGMFMTACIPKYKPRPHKQFDDYFQEADYDPDGPFFYLKGNI